jgi:serine phosphatase RsbU (regulator of sigma subunit)
VILFYGFEFYFHSKQEVLINFPIHLVAFFSFLLSVAYGTYLNFSKRKIIEYYSDLLREKNIINKDMTLARNVQESLFPKIEKIRGIQFEVFKKTTNMIGGDFFDFIMLREGNLGVFITDVAGHGYSSAMVAAMIKVMISTIPYHLKLAPASLLTYLDQKISGEFKSQHASAAYLFIDFFQKKIIYSNAGHPYLLYSKKGQEFKAIQTTGTLIGFGLKNPVSEEIEMTFDSGDRFFLYTDGLVENMNFQDSFLEEKDLIYILNKYNQESINDLKKKILQEVLSYFHNQDFTDDSMFLLFEFE